MIFIERPTIDEVISDESTRNHLKSRADGAKSLEAGSSKITSRWNSFRDGQGKDEIHGPKVCDAVKSFCKHKCIYCELTSAPTIDHFWPKTDYPSKMFEWHNLLAACRDCNSEKRARFLLDTNQNPLMIDPTRDEPLKHFRWDTNTGKCKYVKTDPRAVETAANIALDRYATERFHKLSGLRYYLARCLEEKPISADLRDLLRSELDQSRPYLCIVRSFFLYPEKDEDRLLVRKAIQAVPEILDWVKSWLHPPTGVVWPP